MSNGYVMRLLGRYVYSTITQGADVWAFEGTEASSSEIALAAEKKQTPKKPSEMKSKN